MKINYERASIFSCTKLFQFDLICNVACFHSLKVVDIQLRQHPTYIMLVNFICKSVLEKLQPIFPLKIDYTVNCSYCLSGELYCIHTFCPPVLKRLEKPQWTKNLYQDQD